ncbi:MAG: BPL-N domain-containing protein [Candidatus Thorarchaeota archaeon]
MRIKRFYSRLGFVTLAIFLISFSLIFVSPVRSEATKNAAVSHVDLHDVEVAIYNGYGILGSSRLALNNMFLWMNATTRYVVGSDIRNGTLNTCDILVFPGGSAVSYRNDLEPEGLDIVRDFVRNGGSYFGICGGSLFATNAILGLFDGTYSNPVNGTGIFLTQMYVNRNSSELNMSSEPSSYQVMYWNSAFFYGDGMTTAIPIANYSNNNRPGMIAFRYGEGTVFLSSPHPEYEEGDSRDGTGFSDFLEDPDSEWSLLLRVSCWLVDASIPRRTDYTLVAIGGVGLLGVVIVLYLVKFRRH